VQRWGARNTFDHGHEMLYLQCARIYPPTVHR
jgi:hypothetical protein